MHRSIATLAMMAALVAGDPATANTDGGEDDAKGRRLVEQLYGDALGRVRRSPEVGDDLDLAARLLSAARESRDHADLAAALCRAAHDLAAPHPAGDETAIGALDLLARVSPEEAVASTESRLEIRTRQYATTRGEAKREAGERLIDELLVLARLRVADRQFMRCVGALRRAVQVARAVRSGRLGALSERLAEARRRQQHHRIIDHLEQRLRADPGDEDARRRLVEMLLVDCDGPGQAAARAEGLEDETFVRRVHAASKGVEAAPELACPEMAEWYRELAASAPAPAKGAMLRRAAAYYERFLELHAEDDLARTTAKLALEEIRSEAATTAPAGDVTVADLDAASPEEDKAELPDLPKKRGVVATYTGHTRRVSGLRVSGDGRWLISHADDRLIAWNIDKGATSLNVTVDGKRLWTWVKTDGAYLFVYASRDGPGGGLSVYDLAAGRYLWGVPGDPPLAGRLRRDGEAVLVVGEGQASHRDPATGRVLASRGIDDALAAFSPSGKLLYGLSGGNGLTVTNVATGDSRGPRGLPIRGVPSSLAIAPGGKRAVIRSDDKAYLVDLALARVVRKFESPRGRGGGEAGFACDGKVVWVADYVGAPKYTCFQADTGKALARGASVWPTAVSPDARRIVAPVRRSARARILDAVSGRELDEVRVPDGRFAGYAERACTWSACGEYVFLAPGEVDGEWPVYCVYVGKAEKGGERE